MSFCTKCSIIESITKKSKRNFGSGINPKLSGRIVFERVNSIIENSMSNKEIEENRTNQMYELGMSEPKTPAQALVDFRGAFKRLKKMMLTKIGDMTIEEFEKEREMKWDLESDVREAERKYKELSELSDEEKMAVLSSEKLKIRNEILGMGNRESTVMNSKNRGEWIKHCIDKHVKGDTPPKMTRDQCVAAGYQKFPDKKQ